MYFPEINSSGTKWGEAVVSKRLVEPRRPELSQTAVGRRIIEEPFAKASYAQLRRVANPNTSTGQALRHGMAWGRSGRTEMDGSKNEVFQEGRAAGAKFRQLKARGVSKRERTYDEQDTFQRRRGALTGLLAGGGALALHRGGRGILQTSKQARAFKNLHVGAAGTTKDLLLAGGGAAAGGGAIAINRNSRRNVTRRYS